MAVIGFFDPQAYKLLSVYSLAPSSSEYVDYPIRPIWHMKDGVENFSLDIFNDLKNIKVTYVDENGELIPVEFELTTDELNNVYVEFTTDGGSLTPQNTFLVNNVAYTKIIRNTTQDFDVFAKIDNQKISLTMFNNSTLILVENTTYYGNDNKFNITLINVNGHKISKQLLDVVIRKDNDVVEVFALTTDSFGFTSIDFNYPVGNYTIDIDYHGNGYFEKTHSQSLVKVSPISTILVSHNYTYYGKNNKFYAILTDYNGKYISNQTLILKIYNSKNKLISTSEVKTSSNGRADALLSLDSGSYKLIWQYLGNEWYLWRRQNRRKY